MKNTALKRILGILLLYLIIGTFFGSLKIELALTQGDFAGLSFLRLISHLTLFVTSTIAIVTLGIIIGLGYFSLVLVKSDIELEPYSQAVIWFIWMYILDEISKTFLFYISLPENLGVIKSSTELISITKNQAFLSMAFYSDIVFITFGLFLYSIILKSKELNITWGQVMFSTFMLSLNFIIPRLF